MWKRTLERTRDGRVRKSWLTVADFVEVIGGGYEQKNEERESKTGNFQKKYKWNNVLILIQ